MHLRQEKNHTKGVFELPIPAIVPNITYTPVPLYCKNRVSIVSDGTKLIYQGLTPPHYTKQLDSLRQYIKQHQTTRNSTILDITSYTCYNTQVL
jgi:hypothetical protein